MARLRLLRSVGTVKIVTGVPQLLPRYWCVGSEDRLDNYHYVLLAHYVVERCCVGSEVHVLVVSLAHWLIVFVYRWLIGSLAHEKQSIISVSVHLLVVCVTRRGYLSSQLMWPYVAGCGQRPLAHWLVSQYDIGSP